MAFYDRGVIENFLDVLNAELSMDELRSLDQELSSTTCFNIEADGQDWLIVHENAVDEHARDYMIDQADSAEEAVMRNVEEHLHHLVSFDKEGYIDMEIDGGYEYILAYYDNEEHDLGGWYAYRQG